MVQRPDSVILNNAAHELSYGHNAESLHFAQMSASKEPTQSKITNYGPQIILHDITLSSQLDMMFAGQIESYSAAAK